MLFRPIHCVSVHSLVFLLYELFLEVRSLTPISKGPLWTLATGQSSNQESESSAPASLPLAPSCAKPSRSRVSTALANRGPFLPFSPQKTHAGLSRRSLVLGSSRYRSSLWTAIRVRLVSGLDRHKYDSEFMSIADEAWAFYKRTEECSGDLCRFISKRTVLCKEKVSCVQAKASGVSRIMARLSIYAG